MNGAIILKISPVPINRLLKIAHHAKMPGPGRCILGFKPAPGRIRWPRDFQQHRKLRWIGVLCFIKNYAEILFSHSLGRGRMLQQLICKRDLVGIRHDSSFEAEISIVALNFGRDAESGICNPSSQRCECFPPASRELSCAGRTNRPAQKIPARLVSLLPIGKLRLRVDDVRLSAAFGGDCMHVAEVDLWTRVDLSASQECRTSA